MLVNVETKYEKFLCNCLKEMSRHKYTPNDCLLFVASTGDELVIIDENCDPDDMSLIATRLNTQANMDYIMNALIDMKVKFDEESEID